MVASKKEGRSELKKKLLCDSSHYFKITLKENDK